MSEWTAADVRKHYERMGLPVPADIARQLDLPAAAEAVMAGVRAGIPAPGTRRKGPGLRAIQRKTRELAMAEPDALNPALRFSLPLPPSVNHLYEGRDRRRMSQAGKQWKADARDYARAVAMRDGWRLTRHSKVVVELTVYWPDDSRNRDMSNIHKVLADALEGVIYDNDRLALLRDMDFGTDAGRPRVELRIYQKDGLH